MSCAVPLGHGRPHLRRVLTALALYDPEASGPGPVPAGAGDAPRPGRALPEIRVALA
jgi:hypothetical protein